MRFYSLASSNTRLDCDPVKKKTVLLRMSVTVLQKSKKTEKNEAMGSPVKVHRKCRLGFFFFLSSSIGLRALYPNKNIYSVVLTLHCMLYNTTC